MKLIVVISMNLTGVNLFEIYTHANSELKEMLKHLSD